MRVQDTPQSIIVLKATQILLRASLMFASTQSEMVQNAGILVPLTYRSY